MVAYVEPVADVLALAVDGNGSVLQRVQDDQRDELFGKLVGAVVIRAIRDDHRQAVGVPVSPHEVVAGRLRSRIRRARIVGRRFGEVAFRPQAAEHLIGGDVIEPEALGIGVVAPGLARRFEQGDGAHRVCQDERQRGHDGAVHVAFGRQVYDRGDPMLPEEPLYQRRIGHITPHEPIVRGVFDVPQVEQVARVGQAVEVDELHLGVARHHVEQKVRSDEAGATGHQNDLRPMDYGWCFLRHAGLDGVGGWKIRLQYNAFGGTNFPRPF